VTSLTELTYQQAEIPRWTNTKNGRTRFVQSTETMYWPEGVQTVNLRGSTDDELEEQTMWWGRLYTITCQTYSNETKMS